VLTLIHALIVDRRVFPDDLDDLVFVADARIADHLDRIITFGNSIFGAFTSVSVMA
jgi:hypothetical protein